MFQGEDDGRPSWHSNRHLPYLKDESFPYGCQGAVSLSPMFTSA